MLNLRRCTNKDVDIIYNMSNDPSVRSNSFNSNPIPYEEHCEWYKESLINTNRTMYIVEKDKIVVGQIRLDKQRNSAMISYSIEKNMRKKGYGNKILSLIKKEALNNNISILEALVKKENIASRKAFINNGFIESEEERYFTYVYLLKDGNEVESNKNRK